jgi:hypothetical protein
MGRREAAYFISALDDAMRREYRESLEGRGEEGSYKAQKHTGPVRDRDSAVRLSIPIISRTVHPAGVRMVPTITQRRRQR